MAELDGILDEELTEGTEPEETDPEDSEKGPGGEEAEAASLVSEAFIHRILPDLPINEIWDFQTRATTLVAEYIRTSFSEETYEDEVLPLSKKVVTRHLPIRQVLKVEDLTGEEPVELVEDEDFTVNATHLTFSKATYTPNAIRITYMAGLPEGEIPAIFSVVAEELVRFWAFKYDKVDELFYKKEDMEDRSYENAGVTEEKILSRLARYRYTPYGTVRKGLVRIGVI